MPRAILVIWSVGLIGALLATLAILKQVALVLRALDDIHRLAVITRDAARGIRSNLLPIRGLSGLGPPIGELSEATGALAKAAASIEQKLGALVPSALSRGG